MLSDGEQEVRVLGSLLIIPSEIILLVQSTDVVDLARVVEVMLDDHGDDPFPGTPHPRDIRVERRLMLSCSAFYYRTHFYFTKKDNITRAIFALALALKAKMEDCTCGRKKWFESPREWV